MRESGDFLLNDPPKMAGRSTCLEWLNKEYEKILEHYKQGYERIKNTAVTIKNDSAKSYNMTV